MRKLFTAIFSFLIVSALAQNATHPWSIHVGAGLVDFNGPITKQYARTQAWHGVFTAGASRYLSKSFNLGLQLSGGDVWAPSNVSDPGSNQSATQLERLYDGALVLRYKFDNGYIFRDTALAAPYLFAGIGANYIQDDFHNFLPMGVGIRFNAGKRWSFFAQSQYNAAFNTSSDYLQHSLGVMLNMGKSKKAGVDLSPVDSDADGIADENDECPFAFGTAELGGCPDSDGDGIADSRDKCPKEKGDKSNNGCPVTDRDNDGVADKQDNCPDVFGDKRYNGCPDSDGDGVADNIDNCKNEKGTAANSGCPEAVKPSAQTAYTKEFSVYFDENSSAIRADQKAVLDEAAAYLKAGNYYIKVLAYTSSEGTEEKNAELSMNRGNAVSEYLKAKGVSVYTTVYAWGENNPRHDNNTEDGRKKNRRADIDVYAR